jgi:hypothetical protein
MSNSSAMRSGRRSRGPPGTTRGHVARCLEPAGVICTANYFDGVLEVQYGRAGYAATWWTATDELGSDVLTRDRLGERAALHAVVLHHAGSRVHARARATVAWRKRAPFTLEAGELVTRRGATRIRVRGLERFTMREQELDASRAVAGQITASARPTIAAVGAVGAVRVCWRRGLAHGAPV